ncbi:MAG: glutamine--fructose-6-phosphate transaminase (isomerizing) [Clostridia bacterium]|jgi:glucosamine--fructose-6-phosphate aminotransferase (isomerizing)|nr:glutamine--fructose-6-phosphate transaminase (isomerizing) [Clostridia bacterium]
MCGIVGYTGKQQATPILLDGLSRLEYRGYDSSGIAVGSGNGIEVVKAKGRLAELYKRTGDRPEGTVGIGHTRWATHGAPDDANAHPHYSQDRTFAVVHNGIIENYLELRAFLSERGFTFLSETDTEIVPMLLEYYYNGNMLETIIKTRNKLKGSYALGILHAGDGGAFYALRKDSPLVIGLGEGENFIASDMPAVLTHTRRFIIPDEKEIAVITPSGVTVYNRNQEEIEKEIFVSDMSAADAEKDGFAHFMLKEIYEQPGAVKKTIHDRITPDGIRLDRVRLNGAEIDKVCIAACGSAYHAGEVGKYFIEKYARLPVETDLASEFRYRDPILSKNCLTVIVSQSGETADSLAALREAKRRGSRVLAIVNVVDSSIAREADDVLYTRAGPEIAVATTKGYTTQLAVLYLLGLQLAKDRGTVSDREYDALLGALKALPEQLNRFIDDVNAQAQYLAGKYYPASDAYFIGRGCDWSAALEGALKLKEISYIHAEAYAAGELKHGTISLIEKNSLVLGIATQNDLREKTLSNIKEVRSRGAAVIGISDNPASIAAECDDVIALPETHAALTPVFTAAALQLFAYYVAAARGGDIDKPRNLAKSVTVE